MAAVITTTPVLINNATDRGEAAFSGPYELSGARYLVSIETTPVQGVHVWKSIDSGASYTLMDSANQPVGGGGFYDVLAIGNVLYVAVAENLLTPKLGIKTFDTSTDTWGGFVDSTYLVAGGVLRIANLSTNAVYVFYQAPDTSIRYTTFIAGVFGLEITISAAASQALQGVVVDNIDTIHFFWRKAVAGITSLNHTTIIAGVVSAPQLVHSASNFLFCSSGKSNPTIDGANIVFPSVDDTNFRAGIYNGTPLASPTWTFQQVDDIDWTGLGFAGESDDEVFVFENGGVLYCFWIALDFDNIGNIIDQEYYKTRTAGVWSGAVLFYDAVTNPQTDDPVPPENQFIHATNFAKMIDSTFGSFIALETNTFCAPYSLVDQGGGGCSFTITPIVIAHSVIGGERYDSQVQIIGSEVGGAPVQVITYSVVSGALPPGMTIGKRVSQGAQLSQTTSTGPIVSNNQNTPTGGVFLSSFAVGASNGGVIQGGGNGGNFSNNTQPLPDNKPITYRGRIRLVA